jgi:hypothetical protein
MEITSKRASSRIQVELFRDDKRFKAGQLFSTVHEKYRTTEEMMMMRTARRRKRGDWFYLNNAKQA